MNACGHAALCEAPGPAPRPSAQAQPLPASSVESRPPITFAEMHQRHFEEVYRFAYWLAGNPHDAADLASEAFIRAWSGADAPRTATLKAYLFAIVRNLHRRQWRRSGGNESIDEAFPDPGPSPAVAAERKEELHRALSALNTLPELDRTLVLMRAQDGLSYEEMAAVTGLSVAAAKVRVFRARARLSQLLTPP